MDSVPEEYELNGDLRPESPRSPDASVSPRPDTAKRSWWVPALYLCRLRARGSRARVGYCQLRSAYALCGGGGCRAQCALRLTRTLRSRNGGPGAPTTGESERGQGRGHWRAAS